MHALLFGLKRSWHGSLRVTRRAFAALGLTAARFDLLYALHPQSPYRSSSVTQKDLRRTLGVNRTTISRMLASLEALGLLTRERPLYRDRRTRIVRLTAEGTRRIGHAIARLIGSGNAKLVVDRAVAGDRWFDESVCLCECDLFESYLRKIRAAFRDRATLHYPWHPDD